MSVKLDVLESNIIQYKVSQYQTREDLEAHLKIANSVYRKFSSGEISLSQAEKKILQRNLSVLNAAVNPVQLSLREDEDVFLPGKPVDDDSGIQMGVGESLDLPADQSGASAPRVSLASIGSVQEDGGFQIDALLGVLGAVALHKSVASDGSLPTNPPSPTLSVDEDYIQMDSIGSVDLGEEEAEPTLEERMPALRAEHDALVAAVRAALNHADTLIARGKKDLGLT